MLPFLNAILAQAQLVLHTHNLSMQHAIAAHRRLACALACPPSNILKHNFPDYKGAIVNKFSILQAAQAEQLLALRNLQNACVTPSRLAQLSYDQVANVHEAIAKFQAACIAADIAAEEYRATVTF